MEKELIQKLTNLVNELAIQQQNNQQLAFGLSKQQKTANTQHSLDDQIVHVPQPLLPEQRDEVLETLKSRLKKSLFEQRATQQRNQELKKEKESLQKLVREYETSLETVTNKFRTYANDVSQGQLQLRREYSALLEAEKGTTSALFMENIMLQSQLSQLAKTLRIAHETESFDSQYEQRIAQLEKEKRDLLEMIGFSTENSQPKEIQPPALRIAQTSSVLEEFFNE